MYQFTSAGLIGVWGVLLLFAAWPWRGIVIAAGLEGWMRFGADMGRQTIRGEGRKWRLVVQEIEEKTAIVRLESVDEYETRELRTRPKLRFGWRYS